MVIGWKIINGFPYLFNQQKQINYKPDDETKTQAPIGNIVYEIDDDENQNIYHSPDAVDKIHDDNVEDKLFAIDKNDDEDIDSDGDADSTRIDSLEQPINTHRQHSNKYTDRIDDAAGSKQNGDGAQKQQVQHYDGDDNGARQKYHNSNPVATDKLINRQMNHKNEGK